LFSLNPHQKLDLGDGEDYGFVGEIVNVNPSIVVQAIKDGQIPVVSTVAFGVDEETPYNINADTAASQLAVALRAEKLILLTNTRGVLREKDNDDTLIKYISMDDIDDLKKQNIIEGGMIPKIDCCVDAINGGVLRAHILDGRIPHSILIEILTDEGAGTMIQ
jgi:acetylglutamate kinase